MKRLILSAVLTLALLSTIQAQPAADACRSQIPDGLRQALQQRFPAHDLPQVSDSLAEDVQFDRFRGGNGCILVKRGDFDGDGRENLAFGLAHQTNRVPMVVVALAELESAPWRAVQFRDPVTSSEPGTGCVEE